MREPGEDNDDHVGEYYRMTFGEASPAPTLGEDRCRCLKPPGCWGGSGFHFKPNPDHPTSLPAALVYERCPAYAAAVARSGGPRKRGGRGRGRGSGR